MKPKLKATKRACKKEDGNDGSSGDDSLYSFSSGFGNSHASDSDKSDVPEDFLFCILQSNFNVKESLN